MAGSTFGKRFTCTTWGEAQGASIGVVVDGVPAGLELDENDIQNYLNRRRPGNTTFSSARHENDFVTVNSGLFEGKTTGMPISMTITNSAIRDRGAAGNDNIYRPGHADYSYEMKYGIRDVRGGGRDSGRETAARVAAGAIASAILDKLGVKLCAYVSAIGPVNVRYTNCSMEALEKSPLNMPDPDATQKAMKYLEEVANAGNSSGGVIEVVVSGLPAGIGEPVFAKLDAELAGAVMSIGAIKGVEVGDGFSSAKSTGLDNNDSFISSKNALGGYTVSKRTNHSGGVAGGISDGSELIIRAAVKPTPSIAAEQQTVSKDGENVAFSAKNINDTVIAPRAAVVVEAMTALTLVDLMFENMTAKMDNIVKFYEN